MKMKSSSSSLSLSSKTHPFGCFSLILQRFLCSGTSSTYPSDQITEPGFKSPDFGSEPLRARGAVARLMGLDSIPVDDKTRVVSRSRSVNSVDYLERDNDEIQGKHRRVKSTLDSHKLQEYVELEDDNFFILSFEKDRNEEGFGELKQLGTRKCKKRRGTKENQSETENQTRIEGKENNINAMNVSPGSEMLEMGELKQRRKENRKNRRKRRELKLRQNITENVEKKNWIKSYGPWSRDGDLVNCEVRSMKEEEECGSCNDSSPVSVLDYDRFAGRVTPEQENTSRRRLSSELESSKSNETIQEDHIALTNISRESEIRLHGYQEMWLMICRLTVSELEGSNWVYRKGSKLEDLEGIISEDIVSNILDQLLEETVTTLSLTSEM
ncbi:hypothetical protein EUTSA_v10015324mg [Eutrema salsugineum]|uniref:DUF3741 domain-containing protein n=1 Tax=Eutrema salsugineum TaxID=72664 RepID=V4LJC2_EUTSA|nr:uncharacterized protein LOC18016543 [Eutrema salsugineum]ESQ42512.1 hypothetical protein EUTSA_v10015324mg [Eutrema salsugineum]